MELLSFFFFSAFTAFTCLNISFTLSYYVVYFLPYQIPLLCYPLPHLGLTPLGHMVPRPKPSNINSNQVLPPFPPKLPNMNPNQALPSFFPNSRSSEGLRPTITTVALTSKHFPTEDAQSRRVVKKGYFENPIHEDVVYHILAAASKTEEFDIGGYALGIFIINSIKLEDKIRVVTSAPWFVANKPFVLSEWSLSVPLTRLTFDTMPLWVRIIDLPPSFLSVENAKLIGFMSEKLLEIDEEFLNSRF